MEFRVLGPLEVLDRGEVVALGGSRQRVVLAYLILEANRVVSTDQLIDRIWGDEPPDAARAALFAYISRLRKLLGADRIQARPPGYILLAERNDIDALRFMDLLEEARGLATDPSSVAARLREALDLWRGDALLDLADYDALVPAITRLEELRLGAVEDRIDAEIRLGMHRQAVPMLESLVGEHPLRERLWSLLILALYRSGRQGDALGAFHRARTTLVEELGIDPSPELRRLHEQVLQQDPALDGPSAKPIAAPGEDAAPPFRPQAPAGAAGDAAPARPPTRRWRQRVIAGAVIGLIALGAVAWMVQRSAGLPRMEWKVALEVPLSGVQSGYGIPIRNAVQLAVEEINAGGGIDGSTLEIVVHDEGKGIEAAAEQARQYVADPGVIAVVGPFSSATAFQVVPRTNEAGLLQCSPSNTHPGLTKPRDGALDLRTARPDDINYIRLAPADDIQAVALASFAYRDLRARSALVIDDGDSGRVIADPFEGAFEELGGRTVRLTLNPGSDPTVLLTALDDPLAPPRLVFFGGAPDAGVALRRAMVESDHALTPLLTWDALLDGNSDDHRSYIARVGMPGAVGSYAAHASLPDHKFSFADAYRQRFGIEPDEYAAAGYACVEIIAAAMRGIADAAPAVEEVRELLRAFAVDPTRRWETVLGTIGFDANGDALQQFVTFYRVQASGATGSGDWVIFKKQDFGPAP